MAIDAIGITATTESNIPRNAGINQEEFLEILLTQLRFQDPMKPVDNQQFVAQLAQFSALEINRQQSEKVDTLLQINATGQAMGLIGRQIGLASGAAGEVTAVRFEGGEARLTVRTASGQVDPTVRLVDIVLVREGT